MTTVAYKNGVLAADRRITSQSDVTTDRFRKIGKTRDGWLYAWAGEVAAAQRWVEWVLAEEKEHNAPKGNYNGLLVSPRGWLEEYECGRPIVYPRSMKVHALGSGRKAAMGAMLAGASPERAIKIAASLDSSTGGGVDVVKL